MFEMLVTVYCDGLTAGIDSSLPALVSTLVTIIKIGIPVVLIIFGMMDLGKAVMSNDEKEMKSAQGKFIKRCLYAVIVFFIVAIVQFVVNILGSTGTDTGNTSSTTTTNTNTNKNKNAKTCIQCFINGECNGDANLTQVKSL